MFATLTVSGWIFMLTSTIGVTVLTAWCFWRVLRLPPDDVGEGPPAGLGP